MKLLSMIKANKVVTTSLVVALVSGVGLASAIAGSTQYKESSVSQTVSQSEPVEEPTVKETEVVKPKETTEPTVVEQPVAEEPTPTPEPTPVPVRPDYLHHALKARISAANEEKTWACFTQAVNQVKQRNDFSNEGLIAQVSRHLENPCGNESYTSNGAYLASYVEWCIQRANGQKVPPMTSESMAAKMCSGF